MNSDELTRYATWAVAIIGPILVRWGVPQDTANTLLMSLVPILPTIAAAAVAIYRGWNKRLVHETAIVSGTAPTVADAKQLSTAAGK